MLHYEGRVEADIIVMGIGMEWNIHKSLLECVPSVKLFAGDIAVRQEICMAT